MEKDYYLKAGEITGMVKMSRLQKIMAEAMEYLRIKEAIDSSIHKAYELTVKEYCEKECGVPYTTYNRNELELKQIGKDLWIMKRLLGWRPDEMQALVALPEDSRVKINEKNNVLEVDGQKISLENKTEIQEVVNAILKREALTAKEKELEQKEKKHIEKKLEGLNKEHKLEIEASNKKIADLTALVVDAKTTEGFDTLFKFVERKTDEIFTAASKLNFDEVHKNLENEGHVRALYVQRLKIIRNRFTNCIERLEDGIGAGETV